MKVKVLNSDKWLKGQELDLPLDYAESLISQGVVEEIKEKNNGISKSNKPKRVPNNVVGSEELPSGEE